MTFYEAAARGDIAAMERFCDVEFPELLDPMTFFIALHVAALKGQVAAMAFCFARCGPHHYYDSVAGEAAAGGNIAALAFALSCAEAQGDSPEASLDAAMAAGAQRGDSAVMEWCAARRAGGLGPDRPQ